MPLPSWLQTDSAKTNNQTLFSALLQYLTGTITSIACSWPMQPLRVLVVDDDPLVLMGTVDMLMDMGHSVRKALSASDALEKLQEDSDVDVLLTDQTMTGMTGLELAQLVNAGFPTIAIIIATGHFTLPGFTPALILNKPFTQKQLDEILCLSLARKNSIS